MHGGKGEKKITVMTKAIKKSHLEINTQFESQLGTKSATSGISAHNTQDVNYKTISTLASPKKIKPIAETPQLNDDSISKKRSDNLVIQKRGSGKEAPSPKIQIGPRMSANLLGSPKASMKDKILISYGSQKNLNAIKPMEKRETPHNKMAVRVEELQRLLDEQRSKTTILAIRQSQVLQSLEQFRGENLNLKEENAELRRKVEKYRQLNQETKKMLKQRIYSFNEEGGELQTLKNQIKTLEERVNFLLEENQSLKLQLNRYSDSNLSTIKEDGNIAMSTVREITPFQGSRVSGLYLKDSEEGGQYKEFNGMENMEESLQLQSYITEKEESYLNDHRAGEDAFEKIKGDYEQILASIELKYKNLMEDFQHIIASQASDIYQLELKLDEKVQNTGLSLKMSLELDEIILKAQEEIANLNLSLFELKAANMELIEQAEQHKAQREFLQTELEVCKLKKHFQDQNDNFQFNVVKLNLLTIIDKLKLKIDREKQKYEKLVLRVSSR